MKKFAFAVALSLCATSAHAEKWVKTYSNDIGVEYVDTESLQRNGSNATANFRRDYIDKVERRSKDASGKSFVFVQSRSVMTFECSGNRHSIDQNWELSADGKMRSPTASYPMSQNNDTWDAGAKSAVCK